RTRSPSAPSWPPAPSSPCWPARRSSPGTRPADPAGTSRRTVRGVLRCPLVSTEVADVLDVRVVDSVVGVVYGGARPVGPVENRVETSDRLLTVQEVAGIMRVSNMT